jgi:hypothetical protein
MLRDPRQWAQFTYCKQAVVDIAKASKNVGVIDFMRPSALTRNDEAYWDSAHYRVSHASEIIGGIGNAFVDGHDSGLLFEVLWRPQ